MRVSVPTVDGVPVLLPAHDHPEFGSPGRHYHVDFRFCADPPRQDRVIFSEAEPVPVELEAVRPDGYQVESSAIRVALYLAATHRDARAACGRCPHKGLPVYGGVCVGHSLAFDAAGAVVPPERLRLRVGPATLPVVPGHLSYSFVMPEDGLADRVVLLAPDGRIVIQQRFTGDMVYSFGKGDTLTVTIK